MRAKTRGVGDVNGLDWRSYAEASGSSIPRPDEAETRGWRASRRHGVTASHDSIGEQAQELTEVRNSAPT